MTPTWGLAPTRKTNKTTFGYNKPMSKKRRKKQHLNHVQPKPQNPPTEKMNFSPQMDIVSCLFTVSAYSLF